jgi:hypothetical protein
MGVVFDATDPRMHPGEAGSPGWVGSSDTAVPVFRGPERVIPAGTYRAAVRARGTGGSARAVLRLGDRDGSRLGEWEFEVPDSAEGVDLAATFTIDRPRRLAFELLPVSGRVAARRVYLLAAGQADPPAVVEFEDLPHAGRIADDRKGIQLTAGTDPPMPFVMGPHRLVPAGTWSLSLAYRAPGPGDPGTVRFLGDGRRVLGEARLSPGPGDRLAVADLSLGEETILDCEVRYAAGSDLYLDRMELRRR